MSAGETVECDHNFEPTIVLDPMGGTREFIECSKCHVWEPV